MKNNVNIKFCTSIVFLIGIIFSAFSWSGTVGVNLNGVLVKSEKVALDATGTKWVRGFVDYFHFKDGVKDLSTDPGIQRFKQLKSEGFNVILSLKYDFTNRDFPTTQAQADELLNYHAPLLNELYEYVDVIVAGNEPFIESKPEQRTSELLVEFYKKTAQRVYNYQTLNNKPIKPIYIGAFNRLWLTTEQTQAVEDYLAFAASKAWITGADLHIHHDAYDQINTVFDYVEPRLRSDQNILVTEFSFMKKWKNALNELIPEELTQPPYNRDPSLQVWRYLHRVLDPTQIDRVSHCEWSTFLNNATWFAPEYLQESYNRMNAYSRFHIATYGLYQSYFAGDDYASNTFTSTSDPWIINPLFTNRTVDPIAPGLYFPNVNFLTAFQSLPH